MGGEETLKAESLCRGSFWPGHARPSENAIAAVVVDRSDVERGQRTLVVRSCASHAGADHAPDADQAEGAPKVVFRTYHGAGRRADVRHQIV